MAKQQNPTQANDALLQALSGGFRSPYAGQEQLFGQTATNAQAGADAWKNSYDNSQGWGTKHPRLTLGLGTLAGALIGAPQLGLMLYGQGKQNEVARKQAAVDGYNEWYKNQLTNQESLDKAITPRAGTMTDQAALDAAKQHGDIDINAPDLYQRSLPSFDANGTITPAQNAVPPLSTEDRKAALSRILGVSDINYMRGLQNQDTAEQYKAPSGLNVGGGSQQPGTFTAGASAGDYNATPVNQPLVVNDPQTIMQQLTSARNNALQEGQKRYQFDQAAPDRLAARNKDVAQTGLYGAQTTTEQQRPALIKAETKYKNEQYRGGPAPQQPGEFATLWANATPEQRAAMIRNKANGSAGTNNQTELSSLATLRQQIGKQDPKTGAYDYGVGDPALPGLVQIYNAKAQQLGQPLLRVKQRGTGSQSSAQPSGSKAKFLKAAQGG